MLHQQCILLFIRTPERGKIKKRLSEDLGDKIVLSLYRNFILDVVEMLHRGEFSFKICYYPPHSQKKLKNWLGAYSYMQQKGESLGDRMLNAFRDTFAEGFTEVVIIGSDIPDLPRMILKKAFDFGKYDAVIGPASDGGYYLIGFRKENLLPVIFRDITWGTDTVFEKTMAIFRKNRSKVKVLPKWHDVDRMNDLKELFQRNLNTQFAQSRTMTLLMKNRNLLS
jgi:rSAM/selenodomain-associated transferase 1